MSDTDDTQSERSVEETKKRKRGVINDENYKRNVIKKVQSSGEGLRKLQEKCCSYSKFFRETHYSNKTYLYLDAKLNMKIMFDMFKVKYPTTKIRYSYFVKHFHEHFDIHFGRPQVDTCCKCEELDLKIKIPSLGDAAKKAAAAELAVHKRRAKKFYYSLKESTDKCKIRDDLFVITFEYMQNVHLAEVPVKDLFYLTQLTVSIFGIHNYKTGKYMKVLPIRDQT
ncbi:unnamed protein product [Psylliodes chrysocephalus]|uniref:Uncharacterized protein n=1 Tax=Psylliodes chrysocephalus TaxID=3402493 RepID=A0A9P0GIA6_9CUCU|nr:unnamed protein product [Psylliodes chrysocephala]